MNLKKRPIKDRIQCFLGAYAETASVAHAARLAGIRRREHYRWMTRFPWYAVAFKETRRAAADLLESVAVERATVGWLEPLLYEGRVCAHVRRYSDGLMMFLLRGMMPEKYGVRRQEISGPQATPKQAQVEIIVVEPDGSRRTLQ